MNDTKQPDHDGVYRDALGLPYVPRPKPPQPARSLLNGTLDYKASSSTNIAATFKRIRREQRREQVERQAQPATVLLLPLKVKA